MDILVAHHPLFLESLTFCAEMGLEALPQRLVFFFGKPGAFGDPIPGLPPKLK